MSNTIERGNCLHTHLQAQCIGSIACHYDHDETWACIIVSQMANEPI